MRQSRPLTYRKLARLVDGEVTPSEALVLEKALERSPTGRLRHATVKRVVEAVGDTSEIAGFDLLSAVRQKVSEESDPGEPSRGGRFRSRMVALAVAAGLLTLSLPAVLLLHGGDAQENVVAEFRAKSASGGSDPRSRWIALNVFRLSGNDEPAPLGDTLHRDDGLVFQYTNLGPSPFSHLMVFAIDEESRIYWYYPAFLDERSDPLAIPIQKGVSRSGLHEVIGHPYAAGALTIFGLFSDSELSVSEIEGSVREGLRKSADFEERFDGTRVKAVTVEVRD